MRIDENKTDLVKESLGSNMNTFGLCGSFCLLVTFRRILHLINEVLYFNTSPTFGSVEVSFHKMRYYWSFLLINDHFSCIFCILLKKKWIQTTLLRSTQIETRVWQPSFSFLAFIDWCVNSLKSTRYLSSSIKINPFYLPNLGLLGVEQKMVVAGICAVIKFCLVLCFLFNNIDRHGWEKPFKAVWLIKMRETKINYLQKNPFRNWVTPMMADCLY